MGHYSDHNRLTGCQRMQRSFPFLCSLRFAFLAFVLCFLYLILSIICYYIATFDDDSLPGEFVEMKRTVTHKKDHLLSEPTEQELNARTNKRRVVVKKTGWKLNFIPTLLLMPFGFIPGAAHFMRRRLGGIDAPPAPKQSRISWLTLLLQCFGLVLADWYYLHTLRKQAEGPLIPLYH